MALNRRGFLTGLLAIITSAVTARATTRKSGGETGRDALRLVCLFRHPGGAAGLGRHYLAAAAGEADTARLVTLVSRQLKELSEPVYRAPEAELRSALDEKVRTDFARGEVVMVDGWLLSVTEARLCALATLVPECQSLRRVNTGQEGIPPGG